MFNRFLLFIFIILALGFFLREELNNRTFFDFGFISQKEHFIEEEKIVELVKPQHTIQPSIPLSVPTVKIEVKKQAPLKEVQKTVKNDIEVLDPMDKLLEENNFYDALGLYLDSTEEKQILYSLQIETYLKILAKNNPHKALEFMSTYRDEVPESSIIDTMIETYITLKSYPKSLIFLKIKKEEYLSEEADTKLSKKIKQVASTYIEVLVKNEEYTTLFSFLEEMINYGEHESFYRFKLTEIYIKLHKVEEALTLIDSLQEDEVYSEKVNLFRTRIQAEKNKKKYQYALPLTQYGNHFTLEVWLDNISFTLMLDTGASYIFIDEDRASSFKILRDDLVMHTAGGDIAAKLCEVKHLEISNLKLNNIKITVSSFKNQNIDGLLGMNFFKRFEFLIDQEKKILYLNPKNKKVL